MSYFKILYIFLCFAHNLQQEFVEFVPEKLSVVDIENGVKVCLVFQIKTGFHIQAEKEVPENIIPTSITFRENSDYKVIGHAFKIKTYDTLVLGENTHVVISDEFSIEVDLKTPNRTPASLLEGELAYQACDDTKCYYPRTLNFKTNL